MPRKTSPATHTPRRRWSVATLLALLAFVYAAQAAPSSSGTWVIQLESEQDFGVATSAIMSVYESKGMRSIASSPEVITIGPSFRALAMPAGDSALKAELQNMTSVATVQREAQWELFGAQAQAVPGLDRIDSRQGTDGTFNFPDNGGEGVSVYVIDTGINTQHPDFQGRARFLQDFTGEGNNDQQGHGSHCAGTIGGATFGIAKKSELVAVKVFDASGRGSSTGILRALQAVSQDVQRTGKPSVVNMSLGGPKGPDGDVATQRAIQSLTQQGVNVVVAAGNESQDACNVSPAFIREAITVAAADPRNDQIASFSNVGQCVDITAPGVNIQSVDAKSTGSKQLSGTSMASPHVAGVVAVYRSMGMSAQQAQQKLLADATPDAVKGNLRGTNGRFLFLDPAGGAAGGGGQQQRGGNTGRNQRAGGNGAGAGAGTRQPGTGNRQANAGGQQQQRGGNAGNATGGGQQQRAGGQQKQQRTGNNGQQQQTQQPRNGGVTSVTAAEEETQGIKTTLQ
ncbi:hypothetical protein H9P43_008487 [Blastocladiella emersonii ATCC 22665]|nr:hypothetical protein H9P43_008487 [Blastocladiella emersonii ATCC 22665]